MTQDEIIKMAIDAELNLYVHDLTEKQYIEVIEHFAKLVEDKTRQELRDEIVYKWVPPSFVDYAIKAEREACAKVAESFGKYESDLADAIRARGE